jgi:hypothetical protein
LCDDNRIKLSLNPFSASEDILKLLISSAKNAKCPGEGNICCAIEFTKEVSVDCVMSKWSTCSQTCGPGTQNRTILMSAKNSGKECPGNLNRACNVRNCPGKRINLKKIEFLTAHKTLVELFTTQLYIKDQTYLKQPFPSIQNQDM